MINKTLYCAIWILILSSCFIGEEAPPDQEYWEYDLPSNHNLLDTAMLSLNDAIKFAQFEPVRSMAILKNDKLIFENY